MLECGLTDLNAPNARFLPRNLRFLNWKTVHRTRTHTERLRVIPEEQGIRNNHADKPLRRKVWVTPTGPESALQLQSVDFTCHPFYRV